MRLLSRDTVTMWVSSVGERELVGADGLPTGETVASAGAPRAVPVAVSLPSSSSRWGATPFGSSTASVKLVAVAVGTPDVGMGDVAWVGDAPSLATDGTPSSRAPYVVTGVFRTTGMTQMALSGRDGS